MELREALRTTGAVREFDGTPVSLGAVYELLDTARFAPSGGNRQCWRVVVVEDPERRRAIRDLYLSGWYEYLAQARAGIVPFAPVPDGSAAQRAAMADAPQVAAAAAAGPGGFAEHLDVAPVLVVVVVDLRLVSATDRDADHYTVVGGASVYPFAWSILLAARDAGLGGVLTTMVARREDDLRELLGLEAHHCVAGLLALGRPSSRATKLRRDAVEQFATVDSLDGPPLTR